MTTLLTKISGGGVTTSFKNNQQFLFYFFVDTTLLKGQIVFKKVKSFLKRFPIINKQKHTDFECTIYNSIT